MRIAFVGVGVVRDQAQYFFPVVRFQGSVETHSTGSEELVVQKVFVYASTGLDARVKTSRWAPNLFLNLIKKNAQATFERKGKDTILAAIACVPQFLELLVLCWESLARN